LSELYHRAGALRGKTGPEALAGRRAIDEAQEQWLKTHLSEAQRKRLIEIDLQWEGPSALIRRPVVADHIGLTPEQRTALVQAIAQRDHQRSQGGDLWESEKQLAQKVLSLLTHEQSERWRAMLGRHFSLQPTGGPAENPPHSAHLEDSTPPGHGIKPGERGRR